MHNPFPKKKSKLPPQGKAIVAAIAVQAVRHDEMDEKEAGRFLTEQVGLQWSLVTAVQYLTGQEAINALKGLPNDWEHQGVDKADLIEAVAVAHDTAANIHPTTELSAGLLVPKFKRQRPDSSDDR